MEITNKLLANYIPFNNHLITIKYNKNTFFLNLVTYPIGSMVLVNIC